MSRLMSASPHMFQQQLETRTTEAADAYRELPRLEP